MFAVENSTTSTLDGLFDDQFSAPCEKDIENGYDSDKDNFKHLRRHISKHAEAKLSKA